MRLPRVFSLASTRLDDRMPREGAATHARSPQGSSDGVDLSGARLAMQFELPGDFLGGIDKAKLYLDPSLSTAQRRELDSIFHGAKGGLWGGMRGTIKTWLRRQDCSATNRDRERQAHQTHRCPHPQRVRDGRRGARVCDGDEVLRSCPALMGKSRPRRDCSSGGVDRIRVLWAQTIHRPVADPLNAGEPSLVLKL